MTENITTLLYKPDDTATQKLYRVNLLAQDIKWLSRDLTQPGSKFDTELSMKLIRSSVDQLESIIEHTKRDIHTACSNNKPVSGDIVPSDR